MSEIQRYNANDIFQLLKEDAWNASEMVFINEKDHLKAINKLQAEIDKQSAYIGIAIASQKRRNLLIEKQKAEIERLTKQLESDDE